MAGRRTQLRRTRAAAVALAAAFLVSCGPNPASPQGPTPIPTPAPTVALTRPTGSVSPASDIDFVVASMAANVRIGNKAAYMALVDQSDPAFALEHGRLADEWSGLHPVPDYALAGDDLDIQTDSGTATGKLTATWTNFEGDKRTATWTGQFTRNADGWRYAGEVWSTPEEPHFTIKVAPGAESFVEHVTHDL